MKKKALLLSGMIAASSVAATSSALTTPSIVEGTTAAVENGTPGRGRAVWVAPVLATLEADAFDAQSSAQLLAAS